MQKIYIHAEKTVKDSHQFTAYECSQDLGSITDGYEYGDVKEGKYQIWVYPSGEIYRVEPDREVPEKDYYTTPHTTRGVMWLPKLTELTTDKPKVKAAYQRLANPPKREGILRRISRSLRRKN